MNDFENRNLKGDSILSENLPFVSFWQRLSASGKKYLKIAFPILLIWIADCVFLSIDANDENRIIEVGSPLAFILGIFALLPMAAGILLFALSRFVEITIGGGVIILAVQILGAIADFRTGRTDSFSFENVDWTLVILAIVLIVIGALWMILDIMCSNKTGYSINEYIPKILKKKFFE